MVQSPWLHVRTMRTSTLAWRPDTPALGEWGAPRGTASGRMHAAVVTLTPSCAERVKCSLLLSSVCFFLPVCLVRVGGAGAAASYSYAGMLARQLYAAWHTR